MMKSRAYLILLVMILSGPASAVVVDNFDNIDHFQTYLVSQSDQVIEVIALHQIARWLRLARRTFHFPFI